MSVERRLADEPNEMLAKTGGLTKHIYQPRFWDLQDLSSDFMLEVFHTIRSAAEKPRLRVYTEGLPRPDLVDALSNSSVPLGEDLNAWIQQSIGAEKYCIALDGLTTWSERFHRVMHEKIVTPLLRHTNGLLFGVGFYTFIGNYGYTPFGIHRDDEPTFLIHLGPHAKEAWVWEEDCNLPPEGIPAKDISLQEMETQPNHYTLESGDLLFIPRYSFHLLKTSRFSVMVGMVVFPATPARVVTEALLANVDGTAADEVRYFWESEGDIEYHAQTLVSNVFARELPDVGEELVRSIVKAHARLRSNGFATTKPLRKSVNASDLPLARFKVLRQFEISSFAQGDRLEIFVRGRSVEVKKNEGILQCLHFLKSVDGFSYNEFSSQFGDEWSDRAVASVLSLLVELGGVAMEKIDPVAAV